MKFKKYLEKQEITLKKAADDMGMPYEYVRRYANEEVIPNRDNMQKITAYTCGAVTANDFYEVPNENNS